MLGGFGQRRSATLTTATVRARTLRAAAASAGSGRGCGPDCERQSKATSVELTLIQRQQRHRQRGEAAQARHREVGEVVRAWSELPRASVSTPRGGSARQALPKRQRARSWRRPGGRWRLGALIASSNIKVNLISFNNNSSHLQITVEQHQVRPGAGRDAASVGRPGTRPARVETRREASSSGRPICTRWRSAWSMVSALPARVPSAGARRPGRTAPAGCQTGTRRACQRRRWRPSRRRGRGWRASAARMAPGVHMQQVRDRSACCACASAAPTRPGARAAASSR